MKGSEIEAGIRRIEGLARRDPGRRGFAPHAVKEQLLPCASDLLAGQRVILVTGFCIRAAMIGENDGLSGTLALADALRQLGQDVVLVTDRHSLGLLAAGARVFGDPFDTVCLDQTQTVADRQIDELLASFRPTHVVAIERPGNAIDGHRYSMRGDRLDDLVPGADRLLAPPAARTYRTLAVGDGGNELGLGGLRDELKDKVEHGELIFCATPADHVIACGISNWGGYALCAALSLLSGRQLLRPARHERQVLEALLAAGAVNGCTRQAELSVDGIGWEEYSATLAEIHAIVEQSVP